MLWCLVTRISSAPSRSLFRITCSGKSRLLNETRNGFVIAWFERKFSRLDLARSPDRQSSSIANLSRANSVFRAVSQNSTDAVSDRDFVCEFLFCLAVIGL